MEKIIEEVKQMYKQYENDEHTDQEWYNIIKSNLDTMLFYNKDAYKKQLLKIITLSIVAINSIDNKNKGLYNKYMISKANGIPTDKNAEYFVLRLDEECEPQHREACLEAINIYADKIKNTYPKLSEDIKRKYAIKKTKDEKKVFEVCITSNNIHDNERKQDIIKIIVDFLIDNNYDYDLRTITQFVEGKTTLTFTKYELVKQLVGILYHVQITAKLKDNQ